MNPTSSHNAAVELAISVALLPKGTAFLWRTDDRGLKTDILAKAPADADYFLLARVSGQDVTFADDPITTVAESGA